MKIHIRQVRETLEILSGFETKNKYEINFGDINPKLFAAEVNKGWIKRNFLGSHRPFEILIIDDKEQEVMRIKRPFRFYFHRANTFTLDNRPMGHIQRKFSFLYRKYLILNAEEKIIFEIKGPLWHPWTFNVMDDNKKAAKILKEWSGLFKEMFSNADNYRIEFFEEMEMSKTLLILSAVFFLDFIHFEKKKRGLAGQFVPG